MTISSFKKEAKLIIKGNDLEVIVDSLANYVHEVNLLFLEWESMSGDLWFRGITNESYSLLPGLKWRQGNERIENTIIEEFLLYSPPLQNETMNNNWEKYALMQHYGLPTRLLDWTKSPLVALFFALNSKDDSDRIIWCIDPFELNKYTTNKDTLFTPKEFDEDDGIDLSLYLPESLRINKSKKMPADPIAIEPPFANRRILAQQGCFTVHGWKDKTIDDYYKEMDKSRIKKIKIESSNVSEIKEDLNNMGVRGDSIFQDLNSLTARIINDHF